MMTTLVMMTMTMLVIVLVVVKLKLTERPLLVQEEDGQHNCDERRFE